VNRADEPIAGFNLLECGTLEEAVEVSATHPMAKYGSLELRAIAAYIAPRPSDGEHLSPEPIFEAGLRPSEGDQRSTARRGGFLRGVLRDPAQLH
jgi:hypothetical protein